MACTAGPQEGTSAKCVMDNAFLDTLDPDFCLDPLTEELMVDPVKCSDGRTYDRFVLIDNKIEKSPFDRQPLQIVVDDINIRSLVFERCPQAQKLFRERRDNYERQTVSGGFDYAALQQRVQHIRCWKPAFCLPGSELVQEATTGQLARRPGTDVGTVWTWATSSPERSTFHDHIGHEAGSDIHGDPLWICRQIIKDKLVIGKIGGHLSMRYAFGETEEVFYGRVQVLSNVADFRWVDVSMESLYSLKGCPVPIGHDRLGRGFYAARTTLTGWRYRRNRHSWVAQAIGEAASISKVPGYFAYHLPSPVFTFAGRATGLSLGVHLDRGQAFQILCYPLQGA